MAWRVFQALVIFAVIASNIRWQWTPNTYLASLLGFAAAFTATALVGSFLIRIQTWRDLRAHKRASNGEASLVSSERRRRGRIG